MFITGIRYVKIIKKHSAAELNFVAVSVPAKHQRMIWS
jgi:hypothetical protein